MRFFLTFSFSTAVSFSLTLSLCFFLKSFINSLNSYFYWLLSSENGALSWSFSFWSWDLRFESGDSCCSCSWDGMGVCGEFSSWTGCGLLSSSSWAWGNLSSSCCCSAYISAVKFLATSAVATWVYELNVCSFSWTGVSYVATGDSFYWVCLFFKGDSWRDCSSSWVSLWFLGVSKESELKLAGAL